MRTFKQNANIIKSFMVNGAEYFYLNYYLKGDDFINNIHVDKRDLIRSIKLTEPTQADIDNNNDHSLVNNILKTQILNGLLELETMPVTKDDERLYQHIANCIIGNLEAMFTILRDVLEFNDMYKSVREETIELATDMVYAGIREMWLFILKSAEYEAI